MHYNNRLVAYGGLLETRGVSHTRNGAAATLVVNPSNVANFENRELYCNGVINNFYLYLTQRSKLDANNALHADTKYIYYALT